MFQGKQCIQKFIEKTTENLEKDPFNFLINGIVLDEDQTKYMIYPDMPQSDRIFNIPDLIQHFIDTIKNRIPEEIFKFDDYKKTFTKIVDQLSIVLRKVADADAKALLLTKNALGDIVTDFHNVQKELQKRNKLIRKNRNQEEEKFQIPVNNKIREFMEKCDEFELKFVEIVKILPPVEINKLVNVLRIGVGITLNVYDCELYGKLNARGKVSVFYNPVLISEIKTIVTDFIKPLMFQLNTARKRTLMYKPPILNYEAIIEDWDNKLNLLTHFKHHEFLVKPNPVSQDKDWKLVVFPAGRMASPYTKAITSKGKETRMTGGFYFSQTNTFLLSGTADDMLEEGEIPELSRILYEYVFDLLTHNPDYVKDPIGVEKEKGDYYKIIKKRLCPKLKDLLEDQLDLRYHFTEDLYYFVESLQNGGEKLPKELHVWFIKNLIDPSYEETIEKEEKDSRGGLFSIFR